MRHLTFFLAFCFCGQVCAQDRNSNREKQKFEFESFESGKTVLVKEGKFLTIELVSQDTAHTKSGELLELSDSLLTIRLSYEEFSIKKDGISFRQEFDYDPEIVVSIPNRTINSLRIFQPVSEGFFLAGSIGLLTALVVAPLASIDKQSPKNFNLKRYGIIAGSAGGVTLIGYTVAFSIGRNSKIKLKSGM